MMKETWVDCRYPQTPSVKQALINIADWAKKTPKGDMDLCGLRFRQ